MMQPGLQRSVDHSLPEQRATELLSACRATLRRILAFKLAAA
jgi:hypothetical protein